MGRKLELSGKIFGRLLVLEEAKDGKVKWWCQCSCGSEPFEVIGSDLKSNHTKSCGCLHKEISANNSRIHGKHDSPTYVSWSSMKSRCYNKKIKNFYRYGGRGIKVCDRWLESFENFLEDMGERPSKDCSLDRVDNDGDYTPDNCRWATAKTQGINKSNVLVLTYKGRTLPLVVWCEELNLVYRTIHNRIYTRGYSVEEAFELPKGGRRKTNDFV